MQRGTIPTGRCSTWGTTDPARCFVLEDSCSKKRDLAARELGARARRDVRTPTVRTGPAVQAGAVVIATKRCCAGRGRHGGSVPAATARQRSTPALTDDEAFLHVPAQLGSRRARALVDAHPEYRAVARGDLRGRATAIGRMSIALAARAWACRSRSPTSPQYARAPSCRGAAR